MTAEPVSKTTGRNESRRGSLATTYQEIASPKIRGTGGG